MNDPSRREFVRDSARVLVAGALAGCGHPRTAAAPGTIMVVDIAGLTGDQQSLVTAENGPDGAPILVVRDGPGAFRALSMQCTHEGCPLNPPARGTISCPCHGSQFDLTGKVLKGPAVYPLGQYVTRYDKETGRLTVQSGG